ncbi:retinol-binding protein pinta [Halyomorpha halys]|uniref:retinol-binding protein pinta n=1 Tax=Halyomorpha halys TaxID=286706 RepID=UPI0006D50B96|nr:alpha-tocopherol transfer protein-like [Halyomorpha halys]XP_014287865.1 alpha-tocopherol transfer protein-like [Halyomorpha halys]
MTDPCFDGAKFEIIKRYFGLSEDEFTKNVQKLYEWLITQPHLPHDVDYITLQKFVVNAKFLQEKAEKRVDAYFTVRRLVPYVFSNRDPFCPEIKQCNACIYLGFLPGLTDSGARCIIVRLRDTNPENFNFISFLRRWFFLMDIWLRDDNFVHKIHVIVDSAESTVRHMVKISPKKVKESAACYQNVYPIGIESVIFLNACPLVKVLLEKVLKPMLKEKIAKKIYVYADSAANFTKGLNKSMLPKEYGGDAPTLEEINERWITEMNRNREWLMGQGSILTDETKRKKEDSSPSCSVM